jgi:hypothetical protein
MALILLFFVLSENLLFKYLSVPSIALFITFLIIYLPFRYQSKKLNDFTLAGPALAALYILTCLLSSLINSTPKPFIFGFLGVLYFLFIYSITEKTFSKFINILTLLMTAVLMGALVSLFVYKLGIPPIGRFGSLTLFPFGTFFMDNGTIPRAAGFFLEPGQLSFYICFLIICRELLNKNRWVSLLILITGLLTLSLAHIVFLTTYLGYLIIRSNRNISSSIFNKRTYVNLFPIAVIVFPALLLGMFTFGEWATNRAMAIAEDPFNYSRFNSLLFAYNRLSGDISNYIIGPAPNLAAREYLPRELFNSEYAGVSLYGENPLFPILLGGLLASWPYYLYILISLRELQKGDVASVLLFGFVLLLLQRPYLLEFPYAFTGLIVLNLYFRKKESRWRSA